MMDGNVMDWSKILLRGRVARYATKLPNAKKNGRNGLLSGSEPAEMCLERRRLRKGQQTSISEVSSCCYNDPSLRSGFHKQSFSGCGYCFLPLLRLFRR